MTTLQVYRDDGPLALWLGRYLGRAIPLGQVPLTLVGAVPLVAVLAMPGTAAPAVGAALVAFVLLAAAAARRSDVGSFSWIVPPLLRLVEYAVLIWLTARAAPGAMPMCFAVLGVLAFHHYDAVYRLRHQRVAPPAWTRAVGAGWDGRLLIAYALALAGSLGVGLLTAAVVLSVVFAAESIASWLRFARAERPPDYDDDDLPDE